MGSLPHPVEETKMKEMITQARTQAVVLSALQETGWGITHLESQAAPESMTFQLSPEGSERFRQRLKRVEETHVW